MSINVTVTGNPINTQKGRMVTASPNHSKREFERRRLIRLSQVRQQSKNIAEDIRNRVRQEKLKQAEEIEREGQKKLKQWQAKKLLKLQNQYHEALRFIGSAHKEAKLAEDEADKISEKKEMANKFASERGTIAKKRLREEKEKSKLSSTVLFQKKKLLGHEDRSRILTHLKRSAASLKRRKCETEEHSETEVSGIVTDSDSEYGNNEVEETPFATNVNSNYQDPSCQPSEDIQQSVQIGSNKEGAEQNEQIPSDGNISKFKVSDRDEQLLRELRNQRDTRISDRIRQRHIYQQNQSDPCATPHQSCPTHKKGTYTVTKYPNSIKSGPSNLIPPIEHNIYSCSCCCRNPIVHEVADFTPCHCSYVSPQMRKPGISDINQIRCSEFTDEEDLKKQKVFDNLRPQTSQTRPEIPTKPKITLKSVKSPSKTPYMQKTSHLQDNTGRSKLFSAHAERINEDSLITSPIMSSRNDFLERMKQRDREALERGQKALEREKLQREYNELMKKLPALQKLERMYEMNKDKPEYHMTGDRLREQEKKRQDMLDNAYEKLFPDRRPPTVTIPVKPHSKIVINATQPSPRTDNSLNLNLNNWTSSKKSKKLYTENEVRAFLKEDTSGARSNLHTGQLKVVLQKLRKQKEELLREIQGLPKDSKLSDIFPLSEKNTNSQDATSTASSDTSTISQNLFEKPSKAIISSTNSSSEKHTETSQKKKNVRYTNVKKVEATNMTKSKDGKIKKQPGNTRTNSDLLSSSSYETIEDNGRKPAFKQTQTVQTSQKSKRGLKVRKTLKETKIATTQTPTHKRSLGKEDRNKSEKVNYNAGRESGSSKIVNKDSSAHPDKKTNENQTKVSPPLSPTKVQNGSESKSASMPIAPSPSFNSTDKAIKQSANKAANFISCQCEKKTVPKNAGELCEIVIKIKDGKSSEVFVSDRKGTENKTKLLELEKQSIVKASTQKKGDEKLKQRLQEINDAMADDCCQFVESSKPHSWHEKFSKNNSTSTSYMSPPILPNKSKDQCKPSGYSFGKKLEELDSILVSPPTKLPINSQKVLLEVEKLLNMSRFSIDELGVSSVSTVTTPSQSIIDLESNRVHTTTRMSAKVKTNEQSVTSSDVPGQPGLPNISFLTVSSDNKTLVTSELDTTSEQYPDILEKYSKIAEQCSQRISNLSAMIEKVREEKRRMLESPTLLTTNDSSTKYMDPPSPKKQKNESTSKEDSKSDSSSHSDGNILEIDLGLANKLKALTKEQIEEHLNSSEYRDITLTDHSKAEEHLVNRFRALKESCNLPPEQTSVQQNLKYSADVASSSTSFTPVLQDIPKLPPLVTNSNITKHKKPPPSKGILAARKLIDFPVPHELSTIPEQDSQTKLENTVKEKSPEKRNLVTEKRVDSTDSKESVCVIDNKSGSSVKEIKSRTSNKVSGNVNDELNLSENSLVSSNTSSDEKIEMFRIEAMLRSIGMDWAIATLRKTQEALALTSSSSSIELKSSSNIKQISDSDIRKYLSPQMIQKISSSTLKSDASPGSLNESHELSEIQMEFKNRQASTPVNLSREINRQRDSDLPSAIESEKGFFSLPEHSPE